MKEVEKVLIVDGKANLINTVSKFLAGFRHKKKKLEVFATTNEEAVRMHLREHPDIKIVLLDNSMERQDIGRIPDYIKNLKTHIQIIIISDDIPEQEIIDEYSADDFIDKRKWDSISVKTCIAASLDKYDKLVEASEITKIQERLYIESMMGKGKVMSKVLDTVEKYALIDKPILIEGAIGVGKELIANYLSKLSGRKKMITVSCTTLSKELDGIELFGWVKGSQNKKGFVEAAANGILFLDEFDSLSLNSQIKLLRLIEYKTFNKVGNTVEYQANVRIIAAGNKSFKKLVEKGEFRQNLYEHFIKVIYIPTLKERIEDIDYFIDRFLAEENKMLGKTVIISNEARKLLSNHKWIGNIRQLKNFIDSLVIEVEMNKQSKYVILPELVQDSFNGQNSFNKHPQNKTADIQEEDYTLRTACDIANDSAAKKAILRALDKTRGHNENAIKLLAISHGTYYSLKKKFGIE
jgi:DNA-binding NtrC family response regulator